MSLLAHKQLGLAGGIIAVALNARDESVDAFQRSTVKSLPFEVLIPREVIPELFLGTLLDQFVRMVIAPSIVEIGLDLFEPLLIARTVERGVDLHPKRKTLVVERTSALSTLHSQRADHFATKTSPLYPKELTTSP